MFAFAFTTFANQPSESFETVLDQEKLWREGIVFLNATSFEIDYNDPYIYFTENNRKYRIRWFDPTIPLRKPAGLHPQQQTIIEQYSDTWYFPEYLTVKIGPQKILSREGVSNSSMVTYWESDNNWTRFSFSGLLGFITTSDNNISKAVYETGSINVTIGEPDTSSQFDVNNFIDWYWESLFQFNNEGIPVSVSAFVKILTILNLVSATMVIREMLKL